MADNARNRVTLVVLTILLTSAGKEVAQHMNAKDAPCQTGADSEQTQRFITEAQVAVIGN